MMHFNSHQKNFTIEPEDAIFNLALHYRNVENAKLKMGSAPNQAIFFVASEISALLKHVLASPAEKSYGVYYNILELLYYQSQFKKPELLAGKYLDELRRLKSPRNIRRDDVVTIGLTYDAKSADCIDAKSANFASSLQYIEKTFFALAKNLAASDVKKSKEAGELEPLLRHGVLKSSSTAVHQCAEPGPVVNAAAVAHSEASPATTAKPEQHTSRNCFGFG